MCIICVTVKVGQKKEEISRTAENQSVYSGREKNHLSNIGMMGVQVRRLENVVFGERKGLEGQRDRWGGEGGELGGSNQRKS